jgi:hypothetical protein
MIVGFYHDVIMGDQYVLTSNNSTDGRTGWQFNISQRPADNFRAGFITVGNCLDRLSGAAAQCMDPDNISPADMR